MTTALARLSATPLTLDVAGIGYRGAVFAELQAPPFALTESDLLPAVKDTLKGWIDDRAEGLRLSVITPGSGQAMEYQEAFNEAVQVSNTLAANAGATIEPARFPMLQASLGLGLDPQTGKPSVDIVGEARAVLAAYDAYQRTGAAIRRPRLAGKAAVEAAPTIAAACAALDAIVWPTLG